MGTEWDVDLLVRVEDPAGESTGEMAGWMRHRLDPEVTVTAVGGQRLRLRCRLKAATAVAALHMTELLHSRAGVAAPVVEQIHISELGTAARPSAPELAGVAELAELLKVSKQRVSLMAARGQLPPPVAHLRAGPVWTTDSIRSFLPAWPRKPGRPPKPQPPSKNEVSLAYPEEKTRMSRHPAITSNKPPKPARPSMSSTKPDKPARPVHVDEEAVWAAKPASVQQAYTDRTYPAPRG